MYIENNAAPMQAIMKCPKSPLKKNIPMRDPSVKITKQMHKKPPHIVKSYFVWKAKIVSPMTIAVVNRIA